MKSSGDTIMYEKDEILAEADKLSQRIQSLDTVKEYQAIEQQIHQNKNIETRMKDLKKRRNSLLIYKIMVNSRHCVSLKIKFKISSKTSILYLLLKNLENHKHRQMTYCK